MKGLAVLTAAALVLAAERKFATTSPVSPQDEPKRLGLFAASGLSAKDQDVKDLERLKPFGSFSVLKSHSKVYSNINGQEKELARSKEEVDKDGRLVARVEETVDRSGGAGPRITTALDIPSSSGHNVLHLHESKTEPRNRPVEYSPADMADYIFWTGDERGVTSAVEDYLQQGMMSRGEAIEFLQEIKKSLEQMQDQLAERRQSAKSSYDGRNFYIKKSFQDSFDGSGSGPSNIGSNVVADLMPTEDDYEELIERLKMSDYLFNEYSLEEVIYQLAKVMFTQSLSRGSAEAQGALQKVTGFLDLEAQQGKITRNMEKKVLTVLISALSDTLTEHPELVNTARESLGIPQPEPLVHRLFTQGQIKSVGPEESEQRQKLGDQAPKKRTIQDSGLEDQDKKH